MSENKKNRSIIYVILVAILLVIVIFFYQQNQKLEAQKNKEIELAYLQLDSISNELDKRIATIQELGGDMNKLNAMIDTLTRAKAQLEDEKRALISRESKKIAELTNKVEGYKELLLIKDEEIAQLKEVNERLIQENTTLKVEKNQLSQSIQELRQKETELETKVATASKLQIEGLKVFAVNKRGKEYEEEFRNRHIEKLKVEFSILENEIAPIEGKEILVRIIAPDGNELFDVTKGSGSFTFEGRELFYTTKQEILYDKTRQQVTFFYEKGSDFAIGRHLVEVYTDDYLMGRGFFIVK